MKFKIIPVTLIVTLLLMAVFSPMAAFAANTVSITSTTAPTGTTVGAVYANISLPGADVTFAVMKVGDAINLYSVDQVTSDTSGNVVIPYWLVPDAPTGSYQLMIGGTDVDAPASAAPYAYVSPLDTPTPPPSGYTVSGYVQTYATGATVTLVNGVTAQTDANGLFTFSNVASGNYSLTISAKAALVRTIPITVAGADYAVSLSTNKITLMYGDVDSSGKIDNSDLLTLKGLFSKVSTDPAFNANADLDDSNKIDNSDLLTLKGLFSKTPTDYAAWVK